MLTIWAISIAFLEYFRDSLTPPDGRGRKATLPHRHCCGETIKAMYASGVEAVKKARVLMIAGILAAVIKLLLSIKPLGLTSLADIGFDDFGLVTWGILGPVLWL